MTGDTPSQLTWVQYKRSTNFCAPVSEPSKMVQKQPIQKLFDAMFRGKRLFTDFANGDIDRSFVRRSFKKGGKTRELLDPNEKLKAYHHFLRLFLFDFIPVNKEVVFSYRKGVSAYDAVIRHAQSKHFFVCDIEDFFPSLKRARVGQTILAGRQSCPIADLESWLERVLDLVCIDGAVPMGFSTSPAISNAVLLPFDNAFQRHCLERGLVYTRYSDDIVVSGKDAVAVKEVEESMVTALVEIFMGDLKPNQGKAKLLHVGSKVKLLGMVLLPNGTVSVDASVKSEIEVLIHFYLRDRPKFASLVEDGEQKAEARLAGLLNYVNTVDRAYLDKLRKKFGAAVVDLFLHRSFG
jgi:RNA-directed DNA polymerase